jgi:hypothetical protein
MAPAVPADTVTRERRPRSLRPLLAASLVAASVLGVVACGSGDTASTVTRGASWDPVCPEATSDARYITFRNDLDTTITLDVPPTSWNCDYYSGTSTPATLSGRTVAPGSTSSRMRLELTRKDFYDEVKADFGLRIRAGATTLGNLTRATMGYGSRRNLAVAMDGNWWCIRAMELRDAAGNPIWVRSAHCDDRKDFELQITDTKPS